MSVSDWEPVAFDVVDVAKLNAILINNTIEKGREAGRGRVILSFEQAQALLYASHLVVEKARAVVVAWREEEKKQEGGSDEEG